MTWSKPFEDPIQLSGGREFVTLEQAAAYLIKRRPAEREAPEWQAAIEALIMAAEDRGPLLHARIGMLRALNRGKPSPSSAPRAGKRAKAYRIVR